MARGKTFGMPSAAVAADGHLPDGHLPDDDLTDDDLPDHLFRWSDAVARRLSDEMRAIAPPDIQAIGGRRGRLLQMIPIAGVRVTDLASRAAVTKQAVGQLVDALEELDLVQSGPSESDGRVRWVSRTPAGDAVVEQTLALIAAAEDRLRAEVGRRRFDDMLTTMRELGRDVTW